MKKDLKKLLKEIDFLISDNKKEIALEVKFTQRVSSKELKNLINYVQGKKHSQL